MRSSTSGSGDGPPNSAGCRRISCRSALLTEMEPSDRLQCGYGYTRSGASIGTIDKEIAIIVRRGRDVPPLHDNAPDNGVA